MNQKKKVSRVTTVHYPNCAGIDVAKELPTVGDQAVNSLGGCNTVLQTMTKWLKVHGIEQAALESTGF